MAVATPTVYGKLGGNTGKSATGSAVLKHVGAAVQKKRAVKQKNAAKIVKKALKQPAKGKHAKP